MKQMNVSLGCFPHAPKNKMVELCEWRRKMAADILGDSVETRVESLVQVMISLVCLSHHHSILVRIQFRY